MVAATAEVPEAEAEGKIKDVYADIKATLRVPIVPALFRSLAVYPDYLLMAWRVLKPNAQTVFFESAADRVRRTAVEAVGQARSGSAAPADDGLRGATRALHYAAPKHFLAATALRAASTGQQPKLTELPQDEKRQISPGIPEGVSLTLPPPAEVDAQAAAVLAELAQTLGLERTVSDVAVMAPWPAALAEQWQTWKSVASGPEYRRVLVAVRRVADEAISALPFRMDVYPHALRHAGLSERDIDEIRGLLTVYCRELPALVVGIASMSVGIEGRDRAMESPFPA
ncbi:MAG: hypothetical protein JOZ41_15755 [Chloroflexi bacterium]|nr:hypothetical protein [Chloroflexota bacterium]